MNPVKLVNLVSDEQRKKGILKTFTSCLYCGNKHFGKVRRNVLMQEGMECEKRSILEKIKISFSNFSKFLLTLKLFEDTRIKGIKRA